MTTLRPITKSMAGTFWAGTLRVRRRECWAATTVDGEWAFERIEDTGTPWIVVHWPRTDRAETATTMFGTLTAARQFIEKPGHERWLPSVQADAHARGQHTSPDPYGCRACIRERWAVQP